MLAGTPVPRTCPGIAFRSLPTPSAVFRRAPARNLTISHAYKGIGTDLSRVDEFRRHPNDAGSPEFQIARLSARVAQLTVHLNENKKDYASRRGLYAVLAQRRRLLVYLERTEPSKFHHVLQALNLKPPKHAKTRH